jgi:hypothetical protein
MIIVLQKLLAAEPVTSWIWHSQHSHTEDTQQRNSVSNREM